MIGSVTSPTDGGMLEIGGEDGKVGQGRGTLCSNGRSLRYPFSAIPYMLQCNQFVSQDFVMDPSHTLPLIPEPSTGGERQIKFGMSGCHDTTLAGVLCSLGAFGGEKWPSYTSHIAIELFRKDDEAASTTTNLKDQRRPRMLSFGVSKRNESTQGGIARKKLEELSDGEREKLKGFYVRLRYNDRPMTIPGCRLPGKHLEGNEGFCTLVRMFLLYRHDAC